RRRAPRGCAASSRSRPTRCTARSAPGAFEESTPIAPRSPYSASKAAADHLVQAFHHTHGLDVVITRCSNNYGPYQFPEKLIPLMILNAFEGKPLPVYGDGLYVRDWIHVEDHCDAIDLALLKGRSGEVYNVGAENDRPNRKSTRLNSSHLGSSYAVFCLKKKNNNDIQRHYRNQG